MQSGYVYVLSNPAISGLIKIGCTQDSPKIRARQLSSNTAIPLPFKVEFAIWTSDCKKLESLVHEELAAYRVIFRRNEIRRKREFFRVNLDKTIETIEIYADEINKLEGELEQFRYASIKALTIISLWN